MSDRGPTFRRPIAAVAIGLIVFGLLAAGGKAWLLPRIAPDRVSSGNVALPAPAAPAPIAPAAPDRSTDFVPLPAAIDARPAPPLPAPIVTKPVRDHPVQPLAPPQVATAEGPAQPGTQRIVPPPVVSPAPATEAEQPRTGPSFDIVRVGPQGSAVVAGRATPNADVTLLDNGREIGHAQADQSGQWVVVPDKDLPAGGQELTLAAKEPGKPEVTGNTSAVLVVPAQGPARPAAEPRTPATPLVVLTPADAAPRLLQAPPAEPGARAAAGGKVGLDVVDYDEHGAIRFAGTGAPRTLIRLYVDDVAVGDAIVDPQGRWGIVPSIAVAAGDHRLRVDDLGIGGKVTSRVELPFQRALLSPDEVLTGTVVVQPRQNLWRLARRAYGQGVRYTVIYEANRDQIRNPDLIYPGQIFAIPPFVDGGTAASAGKSK